MKRSSSDVLEIGNARIARGEQETVRLRVSRIPTGGWLTLPVRVLHGAQSGPTMAAPVINLLGLLEGSRYLPDRRDLNRSVPGSRTGSVAARLANLFMTEVVDRCSYGIDYHCGSDGRENLPQVRANLDDDETRRLARAFSAPIMIHAPSPDGSLRRAAVDRGTRVLLYEAGEARRFTPPAIRAGVAGTLNVMAALEMVDTPSGTAPEESASTGPDNAPRTTVESRRRRWVRASRSGVCRLDVELGQHVEEGEVLGEVTNVLGRETAPVRSRASGVVIGRRINPIVFQGEALVHIAVVAEGKP